MASVAAIRSGLKTRIETITGAMVYAKVPGTINFPTGGFAAVVFPGDPLINFDATMGRGSDELNFIVQLFVPDVDNDLAQSQLDALLAGSGALSVRAAIDADETLGGAADFVNVDRAQGYGVVTFAGVECLSVQLVVEVNADG